MSIGISKAAAVCLQHHVSTRSCSQDIQQRLASSSAPCLINTSATCFWCLNLQAKSLKAFYTDKSHTYGVIIMAASVLQVAPSVPSGPGAESFNDCPPRTVVTVALNNRLDALEETPVAISEQASNRILSSTLTEQQAAVSDVSSQTAATAEQVCRSCSV